MLQYSPTSTDSGAPHFSTVENTEVDGLDLEERRLPEDEPDAVLHITRL